jgi:hypothetical protein
MKSSEIVADLRILGFHCVGMRFGTYMSVLWQDVVGAVMIGSVNISA